MKKIIFVLLASVLFSNTHAYAVETSLQDARNKIIGESETIKQSLADSKDPVLMNTMWDSCIMSVSQIDAYSHMLAIYNAITTEKAQRDALVYLMSWLSVTKNSINLNIKSLSNLTIPVEPKTKLHIEKLNELFVNLNHVIDTELNRIAALKKTLEPKAK